METREGVLSVESGGLQTKINRPERLRRHRRLRGSRRRSGRWSRPEKLFERRHQGERSNAENVAAGLPPRRTGSRPGHEHQRQLAPRCSPRNREKPFEPVKLPEKNRSLVERSPTSPQTSSRRCSALSVRKEGAQGSVINTETLETRVAVMEDGKLRRIQHRAHHGRTSRRQHLQRQGSQSRRRLEAAFVDIGLRRTPLHYWDIVPNQFDSGVEIVDRPPPARQASGSRRTSCASSARLGDHFGSPGRIGTKGPRTYRRLPVVISSCCRTRSIRYLPQDRETSRNVSV